MAIRDAAHRYLSMGLSVIPIGLSIEDQQLTDKEIIQKYELIDEKQIPRKRPPIHFQWAKFQKKRADRNLIDYWFTDKYTKLGIVCGEISDLVVFDVDTKANPDALNIFFDNYGKDNPSRFIVETPSGGRHYYYRLIPELKDSTTIFGCIDIRSEGTQVVAPPSEGYTIVRNEVF